MGALEIALVVLVGIWTVIFIIIGIAVVIFLKGIKQALDRINHNLDTADTVAEGVSMPIKAVAGALMGMVGKAAIKQIKKRTNSK